MIKNCILIICFLGTLSIYSQEQYRIIYNYATDEIRYLKINSKGEIIDTLSSPKIRRNSLVELKLQNVNPFATKVETELKEEMVHQGG